MVDGGRCSCQDDLDLEEGSPPPPCCSAHLFTSVLLGVLACVLMTGGVFLAFHRWDPLWLIVSGIGVLLILIGSILHCCGDAQDNSRARHRGPAGKAGCCGGRPDHLSHGHHLVVNNGSLTEQLLPLSNARSVSQLSLNMLPGYFPPVVATYGIEQHSAVVQNIGRLAQQQSPGGAQSTAGGGKSFILLSLPGGEPAHQQASVQNLVGYTVFQLDESSAMESPAPECTPTATATTAPSSPTTPPVQPPLFKSVEVQTCHVWPTSGINPNNSQNASCSNSFTELSPSEIVQNNKLLQKASCSADSTHSGVIKSSGMQKCSSSNASAELTSTVIIQNNKQIQNAPCSSALLASSDVHNNHASKSSSSNSTAELTASEIVQNNKPLQNASCSTESASSGSRQGNPMQKSSKSKNFNKNTVTPGSSQNSSESDMSRMGHSSAQKNSSDNSCSESSPSAINPLIKTSSHNSSLDSAAADPQQPSTSRTEDVSEVANSSSAAILQICDNPKSICDGGTQSSRTEEDTPMSEASSSVPLANSDESLLVVAIPEPSEDNENFLELATPATTDNLVEVDTTNSIPPSTNSVDISAIPTISSVSSSIPTSSSVSPPVSTISSVRPSVSSSDVRAMSTTSVDVSPTTTTCVEDPSTSTSIYDVPRRLTISADVPPAYNNPADVPLVSLDISTDTNVNNSSSSSDTAAFSGDTSASVDSTQQPVLDIEVSRSDTDLNNLSDGEVDESELLDRFSPPPCYDDAIHEGESAIGAFGLAYGTI